MIKAYIDFWKRAFDFSGRSTRPDYWWVYLINVIISTILVVGFVLIPFFSNVSHNPALLNNQTELQKIIFSLCLATNAFSLIELIPQLSLQIRRLRDAGFHPAWVLLSYIGLIPFLAFFTVIGSIVLLIMSCQPTKPAPETQFDKVE
ncbi:MAG: DUF805 domain-containing protein [Streptococcus sp.]